MLREVLLGVVLYPVTKPEAVSLWTDGGEGAARMPQPLPQVLQPLLKTVNCENVNDADEVALLGPVDDVQRILKVGQQTSVLGPEVRKLSGGVLWARLERAATRCHACVRWLQTAAVCVGQQEGSVVLRD